MKVTIGDKTVLHSVTFMCHDNTPTMLEPLLGSVVVKMSITFQPASANETVTTLGSVSWTMDNGIVALTCTGLRNALGTTTEPVKFGDLSNSGVSQKLYFQLAHYWIGDNNLVHFSILLGAPNAA